MTNQTVFFRTPYNYDTDAASNESALSFPGPSMTVQSSKDECDINNIVRRFGLTGTVPGNLKMPTSADFKGAPDFHTAMNLIAAAQAEFMRIPPELRARFNHDPAMLIAYLGDESNYEEALKLGLVNQRVELPPST